MKKLLGLATAVLLVGGGAWAGGDKKDQSAGTSSESMHEGTGGSGSEPSLGTGGTGSTTMTEPSTTAAGEVSGKVVRADQNKVYIEHMGAIVPLKISSTTKFQDPTVKRAKDLKEGQEIRASFKVENKTDNHATSISLSNAGTGGSGLEGSDTGSSSDINSSTPAEPDSSQPMPEDPGTSVPSPQY